jgi:ribosomal protein L29
MQPNDLQKEIDEHARILAKLRLDVAMGGEKDSAKLRRLRKAIARMHTVVSDKKKTPVELKTTKKSSRVRAPKNS